MTSDLLPKVSLNPMDRMLRILHDLLRSRGHPGLLLQTQVWLDGPPDQARVLAGIAGLASRFPLVRGRLIGSGKHAAWLPGPSGPPLRIETLPDDSEDRVREYSERLFTIPLDPADADPVEFHLLRRPGGRAVLVVRWSHVLMDPKGVEQLLPELDRPDAARPEPVATPAPTRVGWFRWLRRLGALTWSAGPAGLVLTPQRTPVPWTDPTQIDVRSLDADQTREVHARAVRLCGLPGLAPVLVAAGFRAINRLAGRRPRFWEVCYTHVPITPRRAGPAAAGHNLHSYLMLQAPVRRSGEALPRSLQRQQFTQLRRGIDQGYLDGVAVLTRFPLLARWSIAPLFRRTSFAFGYHGPVTPTIDELFGVRVERVVSGIPIAWSPPGLWLTASQDRDQLRLILTSVPSALPSGYPGQFLDAVAAELLGVSGG
jgi:hypothetical protein